MTCPRDGGHFPTHSGPRSEGTVGAGALEHPSVSLSAKHCAGSRGRARSPTLIYTRPFRKIVRLPYRQRLVPRRCLPKTQYACSGSCRDPRLPGTVGSGVGRRTGAVAARQPGGRERALTIAVSQRAAGRGRARGTRHVGARGGGQAPAVTACVLGHVVQTPCGQAALSHLPPVQLTGLSSLGPCLALQGTPGFLEVWQPQPDRPISSGASGLEWGWTGQAVRCSPCARGLGVALPAGGRRSQRRCRTHCGPERPA